MMTWNRTLALALVLGVSLTACDGVLEPDLDADPDWTAEASRRAGKGGFANPTDDQRIFYHHFTNSYPEGGFDLYVMDPDGTDVERLTSTLDHDFSPAVSPDGLQVAFVRTEHLVTGQNHVWVKNMDPGFIGRSDVAQLTFEGENNEDPTWSPDGSRIAFASDRNGHFDLYSMNADGSGVERLTSNPHSFDGQAAWSPDGSKIAFTSHRDGNLEIYVVSTVGNGKNTKFKSVTRLTDNGAVDHYPTWSPDGSKIAFVSDRDGNPEIYSMNADGTGIARLTINAANESAPAWSLGGSRIAFVSDRDGNYELYAMNVDGLNVTRLTDNGLSDLDPAWGNRP